MMHYPSYVPLSLLIVLQSQICLQLSWGESPSVETQVDNLGTASDFSLNENVDYTEELHVVEKAKEEVDDSNLCWRRAYLQIFAGCSVIIRDNSEKRKRFAWDLSNCFQNDSGRSYFPHCQPESSMQKCLAKLDDISYQTFLQFFLETSTLCYQLQATVFRHQTEKLVNELVNSARIAEEKMDCMEMKTEQLLQSPNSILASLTTVGQQSTQLEETTKNVSDHMDVVISAKHHWSTPAPHSSPVTITQNIHLFIEVEEYGHPLTSVKIRLVVSDEPWVDLIVECIRSGYNYICHVSWP